MSSINLQESQSSGCETYIAIVVDESGSINENEAQQIRNGLTSFINSQTQSNTTLSLIGMSNSDTNTRSEHVIQKRISGNSSSFLTWINGFGSRSIDPQSDHWASGLSVVNNLTVVPDIIVVVTDGLQANDPDLIKNLYTNLDDKSHVFVYGVTSTAGNVTELVTPLTTFLGKTPILKNSSLSILNTDYIRVPDFSTLGAELNQLSNDLSTAQIGCLPNVSILQNKLVYPVLRRGLAVHQTVGTLVLRNKSRVPLTLSAGTRIHNSSSINGLVFKVKDTVTIPALTNIEVVIRIDGTPGALGSYSAPVVLRNVSNPNGFTINFNVTKELHIVDISTSKTAFQSKNLQIAAAGSKGIDSTKGIHLRWILAGELGEKHLPKGDLFTGANLNFNKADDFVKVYRAPYTKVSYDLNLTQRPQLVDNTNALWIYKTTDPKRSVYVNFKNKEKYLSVKYVLGINPLTNTSDFIQAYGNNIIEIENKSELFFATELKFSSVSSLSVVKLETLSVAENNILATKKVTNRKTYTSNQVNTVRIVAENGRSVRFKANNCLLQEISFEFYSDFIQHANDNGDWDLKGKYALTIDDNKAFEQLEPKLNSVHGKWLKFNDGEYVNVNNYRDKWKSTTTDDDRNIKDVVQKYLDLSEDSSNPTAQETIFFNDSVPMNEPVAGEEAQFAENSTQISNLDLLNIAANDYHVARMLGLGCIDIDEAVLSGEFIYLTEYVTIYNLEGGSSPKEVQHLSMSIPTSVNTERLPLPVQLSKIVPGLNIGSDEDEQAKITDPNGYSFDGKKRYVSLFMDDIMDYSSATAFFNSTAEFDGSTFTFPIYVGVDYKFKGSPSWEKPELSIDLEYSNVTKELIAASYEPTPIIIPESGKSFLNVRQEKTGLNTYVYQGYGINIFSRATSGRQLEITSDIKPVNTLMPPNGINSLLITEENPLMFTSMSEQIKFKTLLDDESVTDKTYIRLLFEYYAIQELLNYPIPDGMSNADALLSDKIYPDNEELFADYFKLYYRDSLPQIEHAKIDNIINNGTNLLTSTVLIREYKILSSGEEIKVNLNETNKTRFIGGILTIGDQNYVIQDVTVFYNNGKFDYAKIEVLRKEVSESLLSDGDATVNSEQIKEIKMPVSGLCSLVENMLTPENWHQPGPLNFKVQLPEALKNIHREIVQPKDSQGVENLQIEKTRGIWRNNVTIQEVLEDAYQVDANGQYVLDENENPILLPETEKKHFGLYKLIFNGYKLEQHPQYNENFENSVEWFNGSVRLFTESCFEAGNSIPVQSRKEFKVVRVDNIGGTEDLVLIVNDPNFKIKMDGTQMMDPSYDNIIVGNKEVNYYPSYKVYLFANPSNGITAANIQPREGENTHYSIFGISSHSNYLDYDSRISVPSPMYAVRIEKPIKPEDVKGTLYATRPDFFNRSTYTFTTRYTHKPYGMLHYRANDDALLNVLYETATIALIRENLNQLGGNNEAYFTNRWQNLLDFDELQNVANYGTFPPESLSEENYHFPIPDSVLLIAEINNFIKWHNTTQGEAVPEITALTALNQVIIPSNAGITENLLAIHFIEQAVQAIFVPLTEVPVIYDYVKDNDYVPVNKKQTIKDKNGNILKYPNPDLDIAPMMKITDAINFKTQFTDFNLDGNSQNIYFYGVREMDIKMNFSEFSKFCGPVKLVASNPPQTPEIKRIMPVLENQVLGIKPAIQIELNAYKREYNIKKINIYRATSMVDAQSIRTMTAVKEILINDDTLSTHFNSVWTVYDEFEDLESIPFGDGLFYRITVSREIEYADPSSTDLNPILNIDYTPSQPSKITATVIADTVSPKSPTLTASGVPTGVNESVIKPIVFSWEKTVHNGKYHLYKMNNQGNWDKIQEKVSNDDTITLSLLETKLGTDELIIKDTDDERIYHHFKIISENSSGMFSSEEKILTL